MKYNPDNEIGRVVGRLREARGLSQRALATESGLSQTAISKLELGMSPGVQAVHLGRIAHVLGVTVDHILREAGLLGGQDETALTVDAVRVLAEQDANIVRLLKNLLSLNSDGRRNLVDFGDFLDERYSGRQGNDSGQGDDPADPVDVDVARLGIPLYGR